MSNRYDEYEEMVLWDDDDWDRKVTVDQFSSQCQAVLKAAKDFTTVDSDVDTGDVLKFDGRWSSTPQTDLPSVGDDFDYVDDLDVAVLVTEAPTALFVLVGGVGPNQDWQGETVTPVVTGPVRNIQVKFGVVALVPSPVYLELYTAPGGALIEITNAIDPAEITINDWNIFKLQTPQILTGAVSYFVIIRTQAVCAAGATYQIENDNTNPYAGGTRFVKTGPGFPPPFAWGAVAGDDLLMRLYAPGEDETDWGTEWSEPYDRLDGTLIDSMYGDGMWIGTDQVNAANVRLVLLKDHLCFGKYSGDNLFIMKFKCPPPEVPIVPGYYWRFYFLTQNCQTIGDFNANGAGYYIKFDALQVELHYFDNAIAADVLIGNAALAGALYNTDLVLCVSVRHDTIAVPADRIDVYVNTAGAVPPYAPMFTVDRGALPGVQQYYYGTCLFRAEAQIGAPAELHGAEVSHFNVYGRVLDYDIAAIAEQSRFLWARETSFPLPEEWTEDETIYHDYKGWPDTLVTALSCRLEVRNKINEEAWNSRLLGTYLYCYRDINVTNLKPIVIVKYPRLVLNGIPFNIDFVDSFDPEEGHLWIDILMGDETMTKVIDTRYKHPTIEHSYYSVSNPIDLGINSGDGYEIKVIARDEAELVSDEVTGGIWVTPDFRTTEYVLIPLSPFESQDEDRPSSGYGRTNAPFYGSDVIMNTFSGSRSWNITGSHTVIGVQRFGKTPEQIIDMVMYEHMLFDTMRKYGVVFKLTLGDGRIIRGAIEDYSAVPTTNPHRIDYSMTFIEVQKPWKSVGQDMIV